MESLLVRRPLRERAGPCHALQLSTEDLQFSMRSSSSAKQKRNPVQSFMAISTWVSVAIVPKK